MDRTEMLKTAARVPFPEFRKRMAIGGGAAGALAGGALGQWLLALEQGRLKGGLIGGTLGGLLGLAGGYFGATPIRDFVDRGKAMAMGMGKMSSIDTASAKERIMNEYFAESLVATAGMLKQAARDSVRDPGGVGEYLGAGAAYGASGGLVGGGLLGLLGGVAAANSAGLPGGAGGGAGALVGSMIGTPIGAVLGLGIGALVHNHRKRKYEEAMGLR